MRHIYDPKNSFEFLRSVPIFDGGGGKHIVAGLGRNRPKAANDWFYQDFDGVLRDFQLHA